jgi:enoyl-CoA hydratase/carnithine racemase
MLLGVAAIIQPVTRTALWLFTTQGRTRELLLFGENIDAATALSWGLVEQVVRYSGENG